MTKHAILFLENRILKKKAETKHKFQASCVKLDYSYHLPSAVFGLFEDYRSADFSEICH